MTDHIIGVLRNYTEGVRSVTDMFSGTGVVAQRLKSEGYAVASNDVLYFSYVLCRGALEMNEPLSKRLCELIGHLNHLTTEDSPWFDTASAFIYQNYSPHDGCGRMFFQSGNALKIDLIRQEIERLRSELSDTEYYYLLSLLVPAVPFVSNITGTYGAYLKYWDKRTYKPLVLEASPVIEGQFACRCFNLDALELARQTESDLTYLDPPYNERQYLPNYHILETIARYDYPEIRGKTGVRVDPAKLSDFCRKSKAAAAFRDLLASIRSRYLLLSYNNEGLLSTEEMTRLFLEAGRAETFRLFSYGYRRYKNKIPNNAEGLAEQLYFIEKDV